MDLGIITMIFVSLQRAWVCFFESSDDDVYNFYASTSLFLFLARVFVVFSLFLISIGVYGSWFSRFYIDRYPLNVFEGMSEVAELLVLL